MKTTAHASVLALALTAPALWGQLIPGSQPAGNPDWTFAGNAGSFPVERLRVLVRCP